MFLTLVICISSLDEDVIVLVVTIKRCQSLLKQVQLTLPQSIRIFCTFLISTYARWGGGLAEAYAVRTRGREVADTGPVHMLLGNFSATFLQI